MRDRKSITTSGRSLNLKRDITLRELRSVNTKKEHTDRERCTNKNRSRTYSDKYYQTWSSPALSLGLETSRVRCLETRFYKSWSQSWSETSESWSWNPRVSVSVLGLGTMETRSSSLRFRPLSWSSTQWHIQSAASIARKSFVRLPPLLLWNGYLATVVCWCGQTGLEWVTACCHSWFTCDATISCKFSWCCTVVISL